MLESVKEERSRHFQLALRIGIPVMVLVLVLAYAVFFRGEEIALDTQSVVLMGGLIFVVVYFIYFALEQGQKESILDPITGVYKYDYFLINIKKRHPKTLAAIKVENLGVINENYGIKRTDELLKDITEKLNRYLYIESSEYPLIGRKVGAEFLIAMNQEPIQVREYLEKFIKGHTEHNDIEVEYNYTLIGCDNDNVEEAIEKLRDLLNTPYKSRLSENSDSIIPNVSMLSTEEQTIINSLKEENIELYFRPILNLKSNKIDIYEISVKLYSNSGNTLLPRHFLPVINRHNLGEQYDILIYSKVLSILPLIDDEISFSFNLSPFSLRKESFHKMMVSKLLESRVDAKRVIIELYEKKTHHRLENYLEVLSSLKRYGFRFCLDNFGSSNASMEYIKHFSFDIVQFDREYISDIDDKKHLSIFTSLVKMVKELDIVTIAKWVDNQKTIDRLKEIDIDYIQGFSVGKVLREDELIAIYNPIKAKESDK